MRQHQDKARNTGAGQRGGKAQAAPKPAAGQAAAAHPVSSDQLLQLQRTLGNRQVQRLVENAPVNREGELTPATEQAIRAHQGAALGAVHRAEMEEAFDTDFSAVRVHTDAQAGQLSTSLQARAFTTGADIFFAQGEYNPASPAGKELLAHELTHVVQQRGGETGASAPRKKLTVNRPGDQYEQEADAVAKRVVQKQLNKKLIIVNGGKEVQAKRTKTAKQVGADSNDTEQSGGEETFTCAEMIGRFARLAARYEKRRDFLRSIATEARTTVDGMSERMTGFMPMYTTAYTRHANKITSFRKQARADGWASELVLGLGIGAGLGLLTAALWPTLAAASVAGVATGIGQGIVQTIILETAKPGGLVPNFGGQDLRSYRQTPDQLQLKITTALLSSERVLSILFQSLDSIAQLLLQIDEVTRALHTGSTTAGNQLIDQYRKLLLKLIKDDEADREADKTLIRLEREIRALKSLLTKPAYYGSVDQILADLWVVWIAHLSMDEADILDQFENDPELGRIIQSRLGVRFGTFNPLVGQYDMTTRDDELKAIGAAMIQAAEIEKRFQAMSAWSTSLAKD